MNRNKKNFFNASIMTSEGACANSLCVSDGKITSVAAEAVSTDAEKIDAGGRLITPGLIDLHTHGIGLYCYESAGDELAEALSESYQYGVTSLFPTLIPAVDNDGVSRLESFSERLASLDAPNVTGIHLEGPFVAVSGAACQTVNGDVGLLEEILSACKGQLKIMTIAPEVQGIIPVIERLREEGVAVFISHTRADFEQTQAAIDAGARHATHFYDVFYPPEGTADGGVRSAGAVEAILGDARCTVDFIPDGVHVHPGIIRMALAAKGYQGVSIITDSMVGAGMDEGVYETPFGFSVSIDSRGGARIADEGHPRQGRLAGSVLTMDAAVNNMLKWFDIPAEDIWTMATANPARVAELSNKGRLEVGYDADFVIWNKTDNKYTPVETWIAGKCVWKKEAN